MSKTNNNTRLPRAKGLDMANYYTYKECAAKAKRIVLNPANVQVIEEFIHIAVMKEKFESFNVPVPNKMILFGPPGTGKTLTAFYMAERLRLPLILVRLDTIIQSYLGETGSNVRKIFDYAKSNPCVLFLDEFDAIARTRDNNDEVKEMSRVVNTLLQCLDDFGDESIFMAATNLEDQLDHAVWRRFDTKMHYGIPDDDRRNEYLRLQSDDFVLENASLIERATVLTAGCSFAEIEQIILKAKRKAIIANTPLQLYQIESSILEYNPHR
ncbi:ATP-binding protein [Cohnella endophytica]|uniref:ATP-binding protein n=1 Tax=Cohnella endophytica TaxID=2419778 RepID=A0A494YD68_9BACL|nr:ATP-binding protein [Cohnella endophytica]RKP58221.1 ATP-binding protein [Cohnella endophytica]